MIRGELETQNKKTKQPKHKQSGCEPQKERSAKMSIKEQIELARKMLESYSKSHKRLPKGNFTIKRAKNGKRK